MRISIDKNDPGYNFTALGTEVYLNGKKQNNCITADDKKGIVIVYAEDKEGKLILEGHDIKTEELHGEVKLVLTQGFKPQAEMPQNTRFGCTGTHGGKNNMCSHCANNIENYPETSEGEQAWREATKIDELVCRLPKGPEGKYWSQYVALHSDG